MHTKRIIPCLDVKEGHVVKGTNFVELRDAGDPVELAALYDTEAADELVFLDITASVEQRKSMLDVINRTAGQVFMPLTVGGGISTVQDIRNALNAGADKISVNTAAVKNPQLIADGAKLFGSQCIVLAVDAKRCGTDKCCICVRKDAYTVLHRTLLFLSFAALLPADRRNHSAGNRKRRRSDILNVRVPRHLFYRTPHL